MRSSLLALCLGSLLLLIPKADAQPAAPPALTAGQWREDLRFLVNEIRTRHPNPYHHTSREQFDAAVADLDRRIPNLQRNQVIVGLMRIAALVGDGHTRVDPRKDEAFGFASLPLKLYWFDDGLYVRAAKPEFRDLVGAKIESIGGIPIAEALRRASEIVSEETVSSARPMAPLYLAMPDMLHALGLSSDRTTASLGLVRGKKKWTARVPAAEIAPKWPADTDISLMTPDGWVDARTGPKPLWLQDPLDYHRLIPLADRGALYAQLNMVTGTKTESMDAYGQRILGQVQASHPKALVFDLRLNQGGYGDTRNGLVADLIRSEGPNTRLFVLVGRGSFSASQFILDDLDRLTDAVFIGEPASSRPTHYGDAFKAVMPNSKISTRTSIKYWQSGQDLRPFNPIQVAATMTFADYVAGRDPALEAALAFVGVASLTDRLVAAAERGGSSNAVESAKSYVDDPTHRYRDIEREFINAEQLMVGKKQGAAALEVARWSAGRFPKSSDLAVIQAYVANAQGAKDEARKAIAAALAIDPSNRAAISVQEEIERK
jgi:hypothetical protein